MRKHVLRNNIAHIFDRKCISSESSPTLRLQQLLRDFQVFPRIPGIRVRCKDTTTARLEGETLAAARALRRKHVEASAPRCRRLSVPPWGKAQRVPRGHRGQAVLVLVHIELEIATSPPAEAIEGSVMCTCMNRHAACKTKNCMNRHAARLLQTSYVIDSS